MLIDAKRIETGRALRADLVVVGTGPAALSLASSLADSALEIVLLESGGVEHDDDAQQYNVGRTVGDNYPPLESTRQRQVGGTSNLWHIDIGPDQVGVRYVPLDPIDFVRRDWVPHSGWPITRKQLDPFYQRAHSLCRLGRMDYDGASYAQFTAPMLPCGAAVQTTMFQFGPRAVFTTELRDSLAARPNVTICHNADVTEVETDDTGQVAIGVRVATHDGRRFHVFADRVVLAAGAIENARLLLLSDRVHRTGLGNTHDVVGRYFMDHPLGPIDRLKPASADLFNLTSLYDLRQVDGIPVMGKLQLTEQTMEREKLVGLSAILLPRPEHFASTSVEAFKDIMRCFKRLKKPFAFRRKIKQALLGADDVLATVAERAHLLPAMPSLRHGGWSLLRGKESRFASYEVIYQVEQTPHPENRIVLDDRKDSLGRRTVQLQWRFSESDTRSEQRSKEIFGRAFAENRIGTLEPLFPFFLSASSHHHMGSTRMSDDPRTGVVDSDCRVHGIENLYIAGSSVFTTGGYANPTLTIVALAIRLADHLRSTPLVRQSTKPQAQPTAVRASVLARSK